MSDQPHFGVARYSIEGDLEEGLGYVTLAQSLLRNTLEQMRVRNLNHLTNQMRLSDDAYCYVICTGGYNQVFIVAEGSQQQTAEQPTVRVLIPDFLSGAVQNGYEIQVEQPDGSTLTTLTAFHPSHECALKFKLDEAFQNIQRLDVKYIDDFSGDLQQPETSKNIYTQYTKLKPTMYTGHMRSLIQVLMGFGRQAKQGNKEKSIYDQPGKKKNSTQRPPTQYQKDVSSNGLRIQYDWKFSRSHGLVFGADKMPWIVEIGISRGVVAWPLPLNELTTTDEFFQRMQDANDTEALAILNQYGGFPTGEPLPTSAAADAWARAGRLLKLVDADGMKPFYDCTAYSTDNGWAFNLRGDEAHNTASYYHADTIQRGVHYMVSMSIGGQRAKPEQTADISGVRAAIQGLSSRDGKAAALWKLDYLDDFQVRSARSALQQSAEQAYSYVDQLQLDPLASNQGNLSKVSEGYVYFPFVAKRNNGNIIRWPEHSLGYLVSKDMRPSSNVSPPAGTVIDTTMHVTFVGDELHWVKFFWDTRPGPDGTETDDFEDCMYVGQWSSHQDTGPRTIPMMFYTSTIDDREELAGITIDTKIKSIDLGYSSIVASDFPPPHPNEGGVGRTKRFMKTTISDTITGTGMVNGVAIPFYDREAYYYGILKSNTQHIHTEKYEYQYLTDPWSYLHWRNMTLWTGECHVGGPPNGNCPSDGPDANGTGQWIKLAQMPWGDCGPVTSRTILPPGIDLGSNPMNNYQPYECGDFADSGPWAQACDNATAMAYSIPEPVLPTPMNSITPATGQYTVWLVDSLGPRTLAVTSSLSPGFWPDETPDPESGATQYMEHGQNAFGEMVLYRYSTDINAGTILNGGPQWPGLNSGFLTFIGVVDG